MPQTFPVVITNSDGKALFDAEIKLSSNHVVTELSATSSTVSFSIDVVASLDVPSGTPLRSCFTFQKLTLPPVSEWYMPRKEDNGGSAQADDSIFVLLVRGLSDRIPVVDESQDLDCTSESDDTLVVNQTPPPAAQTLVSDYEVEGTGTGSRSLLSLFRNQQTYLAHSQTLPLSVPQCAP